MSDSITSRDVRIFLRKIAHEKKLKNDRSICTLFATKPKLIGFISRKLLAHTVRVKLSIDEGHEPLEFEQLVAY